MIQKRPFIYVPKKKGIDDKFDGFVEVSVGADTTTAEFGNVVRYHILNCKDTVKQLTPQISMGKAIKINGKKYCMPNPVGVEWNNAAFTAGRKAVTIVHAKINYYLAGNVNNSIMLVDMLKKSFFGVQYPTGEKIPWADSTIFCAVQYLPYVYICHNTSHAGYQATNFTEARLNTRNRRHTETMGGTLAHSFQPSTGYSWNVSANNPLIGFFNPVTDPTTQSQADTYGLFSVNNYEFINTGLSSLFDSLGKFTNLENYTQAHLLPAYSQTQNRLADYFFSSEGLTIANLRDIFGVSVNSIQNVII